MLFLVATGSQQSFQNVQDINGAISVCLPNRKTVTQGMFCTRKKSSSSLANANSIFPLSHRFRQLACNLLYSWKE